MKAPHCAEGGETICGCRDDEWKGDAQAIVSELARVKAVFQLRAIVAAMGMSDTLNPSVGIGEGLS